MYNTFHKLKISHAFSRNFLTVGSLPFRLFYSVAKKVNWTKTVKRNGAQFKILIKDGMGVMNFVSNYETWLDDIIPKLIGDNRDAVFIDIGVNTGQTMIKVLPHFKDVTYIGVEPNKLCIDYVEALVKLNNFERVKIYRYALSDTDGEAELLTRYQDDLLATTTHSFRKFTKYALKDTVPMTTGDELFKNDDLSKLAVIKIDIEGGEYKAIAGLLNTIKTHQPYIICEINPLNTADEGVTKFRKEAAGSIFSNMKALNYQIINIVTGAHIDHIDEVSPSLESCNYLFVPQHKLATLNLN